MNWFSRLKTFYREVVAEMKKVTFPTRQEVIGTTAVVLVTSVVFAIYLFFADQIIIRLYQGFHRVFGA
jgi:preprotein translocase subunit SecE